MPPAYKLKQISPEEVAFSESNPRGEKAEEIDRDPLFEQLKDSVYQLGVLVPIVVHELPHGAPQHYRLVDGERRLRAALATNIKKVPAHIAPAGDPMADLTQAFHIHMLRKQWKPVAQARALRRMLAHLHKTGSLKTEEEVLDELRQLTGCSDTRLKTLRRASKYRDEVLHEVDSGQLAFSHLVQFEESFVEQLAQHYMKLLKDLGRQRVRQVLLDKARRKILTSTRALMENIVPVVTRAKTHAEKAYAEKLLRDFIANEDMPAEYVLKEFEQKFPHAQGDVLKLAKEVMEQGQVLLRLLQDLDIGQLVGFPKIAREMRTHLADLRAALSRKLRSLGAATRP